MRDILVTLIVFGGCIYTLKKPYAGILLWSWLSYMNPHRLCYGFAYSMPFAQITALTLFASMLFSKEAKKLPTNNITLIWILFIIWMGITTLFAYFPSIAAAEYVRTLKIQIIIFLTMMLINDMNKLKQLIWVIALSIGYFSVKGGVFTLLTGGAHKVWGPPSSFIEDNNGLAVAILMVIPLVVYLYQIYDVKWIKRGLLFAIIFSLFTVVGSQSRGALLAIVAVGGFYWTKSEHKVVSGIFILIIAAAILAFMPDTWFQRMDTINTYDADASAMGRINAWHYAFNAANHNILGMGYESWSAQTFALYAPIPTLFLTAHSIYFCVLGDHGWIGLILFLTVFRLTWVALKNIIKQSKNNEALREVNLLAKMLQVSLIAYFVGGAFLSLSYFDLPWHIVGITVCLQAILQSMSSTQTVPQFKNASGQPLRRGLQDAADG